MVSSRFPRIPFLFKTELLFTVSFSALFRFRFSLGKLIRHENRASRKRSSNLRILKTLALRLKCGRKTFWKRGFSKTMTSLYSWFLCLSLFKHKCKMTGDCCVFKCLRCSVDGKHLMRFRVKLPFSNSSGLVWTGPLLSKTFLTVLYVSGWIADRFSSSPLVRRERIGKERSKVVY